MADCGGESRQEAMLDVDDDDASLLLVGNFVGEEAQLGEGARAPKGRDDDGQNEEGHRHSGPAQAPRLLRLPPTRLQRVQRRRNGGEEPVGRNAGQRPHDVSSGEKVVTINVCIWNEKWVPRGQFGGPGGVEDHFQIDSNRFGQALPGAKSRLGQLAAKLPAGISAAE